MSKSQNKIPATVQHATNKLERKEGEPLRRHPVLSGHSITVCLEHEELEEGCTVCYPPVLDKFTERLNDFNIRLNKVEVEMGMWGGKKIIPINE